MTSLDARREGGQAATYTSEEAAALLGVSRNVLQDNAAQLGAIRIGRTIRFPRSVIDAKVQMPEPPEAAADAAQVAADPRIEVLLPALKVVCREVALLLAARRREVHDPESRAELSEARMAVEDCLADLNALMADRRAH